LIIAAMGIGILVSGVFGTIKYVGVFGTIKYVC
jgi:hypothetical protein